MSCWPWAFLLPLVVQAQSGSDGEPILDCTSHISVKYWGTLTCQFDIDDADEVTDITLCLANMSNKTCRGGKLKGNTVVFEQLQTIGRYELRFQFPTAEKIITYRKEYDLKSIIKPTAPWIINATFLEKSGTVPIYIGTQYLQREFLTNKLIFDLDITSAGNSTLRKEVSYSPVRVDQSHLRYNTNYHVRVRAKPNGDYFKGTWSDWSPYVSFQTPTLLDPDSSLLVYTPIAAAIILLLIVVIAILRWHKHIKSCFWPRIPNPKNTLLQMYKPNKALPISFNPEVFSDQFIHLVDHIEAKVVELEIPGGGRSICEVRGREREVLTMWKPGDLEGILPKPSTEERVGGVAQMTGVLDGSGGVRGGSWPKTPMVPSTGRREEPYITMSSLFNTQ